MSIHLQATTRIFREWCNRIDSGVFTKTQCQQWARAIYPLAHDREPSGKRTALSNREARALMGMIQDAGGVRLTPDHTQQGLDWLKSRRCPIDLPAGTLDAFSHFTFQGQAYGTVPVWRIHLHSGRAIDYYAFAWQASSKESAEWDWVRTSGGGR